MTRPELYSAPAAGSVRAGLNSDARLETAYAEAEHGERDQWESVEHAPKYVRHGRTPHGTVQKPDRGRRNCCAGNDAEVQRDGAG